MIYLVLPVNIKIILNYEYSVSYTLYQPNIYPHQVYKHNNHSKIIKKYIDILEQNKSSSLIIFPETYSQFHIIRNMNFIKLLIIIYDKKFIISGLFTEFENKYFNSMVFFF